jgi:hypothetical protein
MVFRKKKLLSKNASGKFVSTRSLLSERADNQPISEEGCHEEGCDCGDEEHGSHGDEEDGSDYVDNEGEGEEEEEQEAARAASKKRKLKSARTLRRDKVNAHEGVVESTPKIYSFFLRKVSDSPPMNEASSGSADIAEDLGDDSDVEFGSVDENDSYYDCHEYESEDDTFLNSEEGQMKFQNVCAEMDDYVELTSGKDDSRSDSGESSDCGDHDNNNEEHEVDDAGPKLSAEGSNSNSMRQSRSCQKRETNYRADTGKPRGRGGHGEWTSTESTKKGKFGRWKKLIATSQDCKNKGGKRKAAAARKADKRKEKARMERERRQKAEREVNQAALEALNNALAGRPTLAERRRNLQSIVECATQLQKDDGVCATTEKAKVLMGYFNLQ